MNNQSFFEQLSLNISSNLEPAKAWARTFNVLEQHFPIEAISLHRFKPQYSALHLEFLVLKEQFLELDTMVPLWDQKVVEAPGPGARHEIINFTSAMQQHVTTLIHSGIQVHLSDNRDRAMLVAVLETEEEVVGHLCLIGKTTHCFSQEHIDKLKLIQPPLSLALINMHRYVQTEELKSRLDSERQQLAGEVRLLKESSIIGSNSGLRSTMKLIEQLIGKEATTLILGETGTGKEIVADAIQRASLRSDKPFIKVNCGAIPSSLIDSELFGHQKGAFTGAIGNKMGRFEQADGGTLFLDEVAELPLQAQVRLLRVLQNGSFERVGGEKTIRVDVRIIAATNRPLENMLKSGAFREDLFYRLNVFPIHIPPLRERLEDIPLLIRHFIKENSKQLSLSHILPISAHSIDKLRLYTWPGNVRELKNLVERAITIDPESDLDLSRYLPGNTPQHLNDGLKEDPLNEISPSDLKSIIRQQIQEVLTEQTLADLISVTTTNTAETPTLDEVMIDHITKVLKQCYGKINGPGGAAEKLAIHPNTLRKRMQKLNITFEHD